VTIGTPAARRHRRARETAPSGSVIWATIIIDDGSGTLWRSTWAVREVASECDPGSYEFCRSVVTFPIVQRYEPSACNAPG
jgi:hypothetical protein